MEGNSNKKGQAQELPPSKEFRFELICAADGADADIFCIPVDKLGLMSEDGGIVFYNETTSRCGSIKLTEDEEISITLDKTPPSVERIFLFASCFKSTFRNECISLVLNSGDGHSISSEYILAASQKIHSVLLGVLQRHGDVWIYGTPGIAMEGDMNQVAEMMSGQAPISRFWDASIANCMLPMNRMTDVTQGEMIDRFSWSHPSMLGTLMDGVYSPAFGRECGAMVLLRLQALAESSRSGRENNPPKKSEQLSAQTVSLVQQLIMDGADWYSILPTVSATESSCSLADKGAALLNYAKRNPAWVSAVLGAQDADSLRAYANTPQHADCLYRLHPAPCLLPLMSGKARREAVEQDFGL